ncbi:DUF4255 domain-containing protein [Caulobacter sp. LjRoot300]|uniref:DUF4255 domain-containing protein n=1 Tax=Caulobacter sp. LjRoot300 TaxID=3342321 RepID=UPI003ECC1A26
MAGPFAIAAVTAVLKDLLNDGLANHDLSALGHVAVTALAPDRIPVTTAEEKSQINLFMYQVTPNIGWRNVGLPSRGASGERLTNPPLALDLHYLVTAYGKVEFHAEALLGYAMQLLHERPILTREMIRATLKPALPPEVTLPPELAMISSADLADQVETIKISPAHLGTEEMSRLWAAMQAKYRPTAVYHLSVVLIDAGRPAKAGLPVLRQADDGKGPTAGAGITPPFPIIQSVSFPSGQLQALLGDAVVVEGGNFALATGKAADVTAFVRLASALRGVSLDIPVPTIDRGDARLGFTVPNTPAALPAGVYGLSIGVTPTAPGGDTRFSNVAPLSIAPVILTGLAPVARTAVDPATDLGLATINITCSPQVLPDQRVTLVLGAKEIQANQHPTKTSALTFVAPLMATGSYRVRLRIDGSESLLVQGAASGDPQFDPTQTLDLT